MSPRGPVLRKADDTTLARPANFGRFATVYAPVEWLTFGRGLSRRRECFLEHPRIKTAQRALILGDGDGRFTAALLQRNPKLEVTAVDVSATMLAHLQRRVRARVPQARLTLECADIRSWPVTGAGYDLVASHFFFDCFTTPEVERLIAGTAPALAPSAVWLVSEFAIPDRSFWTPAAKLLVRLLYFTIGTLTGLEHTQLPEHASSLKAAGLQLLEVDTAFGGTLRSEIWQTATLADGGR